MFHWFGVVQNTRGDVLPGWQVECVQLADGATVVPIFADESSTPIASVSGVTNRAVANENGNYDFFVPSGTYSLRFYNTSGVFQRSLRYLTMYGEDFATDSANMGFTQSGAGAVSETVQTTLRRTVYASQYSSLQAAITANPGRDIILSPGVTTVGLLTIAGNNTRLIGSRACTLRRADNTAGNFITITGASCALIGFVIDGNRANQTYAYNVREVLVQAAKAEIRGLRISNAISHGIGVVGGALQPTISDNEVETCGDFGIFVDNNGGGTDPAYGLCENNTVQDFGIAGGGGGATTSVGIGVRSLLGGWRISGNLVRQVTARANEQLGIECWTNSNNMVVEGNTIDMIGHGEFGLSITGYGSVVSGNLVLGTSSYAIELIDRAATCTGNVIRSPLGSGVSINLNSGHADPGDVITVTGNTVENTVNVVGANAAITVTGDVGVTPIAITISGNTTHGLSHGIVVTDLVTGCTITGNTCYNTGSIQAGIIPLGTDMTVSGNTIVRVAAAGTGNGGGIVMGGSGHLITGNRISGNSRIDNAILVNVGATNCVIDGNFITGANSNAVFCNATGSSIVVKNNVGNAGYALQSGNRAFQNLNTTNGINVSQQMGMGLGVFTVATLPATSIVGTEAYVTDANATTFNSVVAGGGSNKVPVTYDGAAWRIG
jgi:hypothetical protein